jgi:predicted nuclease with TOPRIM domain
MSEDLTKNIPGSFEERILAEFAAMRQEFAAVRQESAEQREMIRHLHEMIQHLHARLNSVDARLTSLEDKVDARLRETRPIWEGVQQRLTTIEKELTTLNRQFRTLIHDSIDMRSRVEKLEDEAAARET